MQCACLGRLPALVWRAYALQGQTAKSGSSYEAFLNHWKDADADIPILHQAEAE